jgi:hypothetical protein
MLQPGNAQCGGDGKNFDGYAGGFTRKQPAASLQKKPRKRMGAFHGASMACIDPALDLYESVRTRWIPGEHS